MKNREKNNIIRPDMINILMEARKATDRKRDWNDYEIVAQCFGFFMGAFENTSTILCFALYEITINLEIQEKLRNEIDNVRKNLKEEESITYEILSNMKYLDMVVSETLRKWPIVALTDRVCNKNYILKISEDHEIFFKIGESCTINIIGLHYDPENFPNPEKFDPERFSEQNKQNIKPYTYLPFGSGIRNCIGNRFALMEIKAILYYLLSEFNFELSTKTRLPIELETRVFHLQPKGGFWLKICSRN
ncbi:probable cytochrome P450 9f2 [Condylostylus longicornis]|uniref:probable cytochrome P450 9f2 n=1 Tax=Condylostylus longicornis TaxID=2530218 RepID=UPI00244DF95C|nr:probable cytochrome P450 9f2 [Condylostylus longicornis]